MIIEFTTMGKKMRIKSCSVVLICFYHIEHSNFPLSIFMIGNKRKKTYLNINLFFAKVFQLSEMFVPLFMLKPKKKSTNVSVSLCERL